MQLGSIFNIKHIVTSNESLYVLYFALLDVNRHAENNMIPSNQESLSSELLSSSLSLAYTSYLLSPSLSEYTGK